MKEDYKKQIKAEKLKKEHFRVDFKFTCKLTYKEHFRVYRETRELEGMINNSATISNSLFTKINLIYRKYPRCKI